ncbi:unnamed protein product [Symbiodinium sp. KB8]|nr:unnamed protein product [Symbiodinium sp. KB8]
MDPDFRKRSPEQKGREGREGREASSVEDGDLVAHPFWSERARAEVDLMRARPADLDLQGEVRVDEEEIHPSYENTSEPLVGQSKGRSTTSERPRELARIQEVEVNSGEEGTRVSSSQPPDLLSMSPEKPEASSPTKREIPKPALEPSDVGPAGQQREMSSMLAGVQNLSGSGALDSEVGGSSRAFRRSALETSEDAGAQEVSSTTVESVSDGKVLNTSHSFSGAQGSLKGLAYEISDPSDQYFEIVSSDPMDFLRASPTPSPPMDFDPQSMSLSGPGPPNALMIEDGTMDFSSPPAEAANQAYVRWLATSPLERLSIQKEFDQVTLVQPQHALLEQRCVTLILQALPDELRVDIVASRHLSVAGMIFRLMTVFQPGGASERATMLRFLVTPKVAATLSEAAKLLRQWAQWRMRLTQLQAAEPDTTLLVKGLDTLTQKALAKHPSSLFRLATFRERLGIDYAPTSEAVSELCRMLQAEVEHLSHSGADEGPQKEDTDNKRQKLQKVLSPAAPKPSSPVHPSPKASGAKPCKNWLTAGGCSYGSTCQFFHDQSEEKMKGRCFSCSAEDHWADTCRVKARLKAEAKAAAEESPSGNPKSPKSSSDGSPKGKGKGKKEGKGKGDKQIAKPKIRAADPQKPPPSSEEQPSPGTPNAETSTAASNAEILNVLRSIKTKSFRVRVVNDETGYGLLDSGASAALRQGTQQEIDSSIPVTVSLAVGEMVMFRNDSGTLLVREAVQPIVPMSALPLLGCEISWSDRGCFVRHPSQGLLPVRLRDGTSELPANLVLRLIAEYERFLLRHQAVRDTSARVWQHALGKDDVSLGSLKEWLGKHLSNDSCGELELQTVSKVLFPDLPEALASQVATSPSFDPSRVPFNRRTRRQLFDPQVPTMVHLFAGQHRWRNSVGQVLEVDAAKGADLLSDDVFGMLLRAATSGAIDGVVGVFQATPQYRRPSKSPAVREFSGDVDEGPKASGDDNSVAKVVLLRITEVDHNDRADVNAPVARWERHYAVLTDEEDLLLALTVESVHPAGILVQAPPSEWHAFPCAPVTSSQVLKAITMYVKQKDAVNRISKRPIAGSYRESTSEAALPPWFWSSGAWVFSGKVGVTKTVATCPWFTRLLVAALSHQTPQGFATIAFLVNIETEVHKDSHNDASSMNLAWNVGQGGGSLEVSGYRIALPPGAWVSFPPREFHKSGPWDGNKVLVLGYTPRSLEKLTSAELLSLRWVGMPFDHSLPSDSPRLAVIDCESGDEEMTLPSEMSWDQVGQDFEHMHHCVTFFLKTLQRSVVGSSSEGPVDPITLQAMREAAALRRELEWHLELARLQGCEVPVSSSAWRVCAAAPAAEHLESQPLLHTRIVSNEEVREKLHEWRDAMKAESDSLISKGAVELVADSQVDQWIAEGKDVEILPGRGVATEKPPTSPGASKRNKYRAVICGNFQKWSEERASESFYAGSGTDIKTAFLNAPLDEGEAEFLICNPPKATWECSAFSHTEEGTVEYCGLEISVIPDFQSQACATYHHAWNFKKFANCCSPSSS